MNREAILSKKAEDGKPYEYAANEIYAGIKQVEVDINNSFLPAIEVVLPEIAEQYFQWNNYRIYGYGKEQ